MEYSLKVHKDGKVIEQSVVEGTNLLKFLRKNDYEVGAPCGGSGTCGKCKIIVEGLTGIPSKRESKMLGDKALSKGYRLACYNTVENDLEIFLDGSKENANIVTEGRKRDFKFAPIVSKKYNSLSEPDLKDQRSDMERISDKIGEDYKNFDLELIRRLPQILREDSYKVTMVFVNDKLINIEAGNTTNKMYGLAVDVGTTTIAAYLIDLVSGKEVGVYSCLNPQGKYGADVISRISYTNESKEKLLEMNSVIISCINDIVRILVNSIGASKDEIYSTVFVGNTTMMHFLMNITAKYMAVAPFIPVTTEIQIIKASELGIEINNRGAVVMVPSVSAYIGADTIAAVISSGMFDDDKISLLVDIGTNGEIVLGYKKWLYACSVAAGPAFEGAHIRNGVGGIRGAIDSISLKNGLEYTTIGGSKAIGICGSGIVDSVAELLQSGIIDETGRILDVEEMNNKTAEEYKHRIIELDGITSFLISDNENNQANMDIAITQKDIRELQNAKAAVAAGINVLIKEAGINIDDIEQVYLAGGFGNYMNIDSALKIGLLPQKLKGKIESIGNAAGSGAVEILTSSKMIKKAGNIKKAIKYIELSSNKEFVDEYIELMMFRDY